MNRLIVILSFVFLLVYGSQQCYANDSIPQLVDKQPVKLVTPSIDNGIRMPLRIFIECYYADGAVCFLPSKLYHVLNVTIVDVASGEEFYGIVSEYSREVFVGDTMGTLFVRCESDDGTIFEGYIMT